MQSYQVAITLSHQEGKKSRTIANKSTTEDKIRQVNL